MKIDQNRTFFIGVTLYKITDFEALEIGKIQLIHTSHLQENGDFLGLKVDEIFLPFSR